MPDTYTTQNTATSTWVEKSNDKPATSGGWGVGAWGVGPWGGGPGPVLNQTKASDTYVGVKNI